MHLFFILSVCRRVEIYPRREKTHCPVRMLGRAGCHDVSNMAALTPRGAWGGAKKKIKLKSSSSVSSRAVHVGNVLRLDFQRKKKEKVTTAKRPQQSVHSRTKKKKDNQI